MVTVLTSASLVTTILIVTVVGVALHQLVCKLQGKQLTLGGVARGLAYMAGADFVIGFFYGWPFPANPSPVMATLWVAAGVTVLMASGLLWAHLSRPTPAVVQYRELRAARRSR